MASTIRCLWGPPPTPGIPCARDIFVLQWRHAPSDQEMERAIQLLACLRVGAGHDERLRLQEPRPQQECYLVTTRGFISAWSSIATEIAHHCGLRNLHRLERMRFLPAGSVDECDRRRLESGSVSLYDPLLEKMIRYSKTDPECAWESVLERALAGSPAPPPHSVPLLENGAGALDEADKRMRLGLDEAKKRHLLAHYTGIRRDPTDTELMTFALFHSEHCRHGIFNADWRGDGRDSGQTLFDLIRATTQANGQRVLSAYSDNAAVLRGFQETVFAPGADDRYRYNRKRLHIVLKVETHNHPTAICPHPGAATGAGGELRDESATGRGARPGAGLVGFTVGDLSFPDGNPLSAGRCPPNLATADTIMREAPLGAADYNNKFGRPVLCGYFRSYERRKDESDRSSYGYFKPIMIAGGHGYVAEEQVRKRPVRPGLRLVLLGGPAFRIGLGGGTASSGIAAAGDREADFASVQRGQADMQRRCQEVIDRCHGMGPDNPIFSLHDIGAGGLANAVPEILDRHGADLDLDRIPVSTDMNPMEIWCNESQERFILLLDQDDLPRFARLCERENAPHAVIGRVTEKDGQLRLNARTGPGVLSLPMPWLCERLPEPALSIPAATPPERTDSLSFASVPPLEEAAERVLSTPTVGDKTFLITIGDRTVGGLVARDQMVGPWQVPVADCCVTADDYDALTGVAMAMGERTPVATQDPAASVRMAITEALTNLCPARVLALRRVALSANWMAAPDTPERRAELRAGVSAANAFCRALGIPVPVGKDSLSMRVRWKDPGGGHYDSVAPLSLIATAVAPVTDPKRTLTPQLQPAGDLILADLGEGRNRLGASILRQWYPPAAPEPVADIDDATRVVRFFQTAQLLNEAGYLTAWHDRSDGGLFTCLCEMAFASRLGVDMCLPAADPRSLIAQLFSEEAGAVMQVAEGKTAEVLRLWEQAGIAVHPVGTVNDDERLRIHRSGNRVYDEDISRLRRFWSRYHHRMRRQRDDPECADEELEHIVSGGHASLKQASQKTGGDEEHGGLYARAPAPSDTPPRIGGHRPRLAVLRAQGVNGQREMAAAFDRAGFNCFDLHMTDLARGEKTLGEYHMLAIPGGFSYGDVLGAGYGWAMSVLYDERLREMFSDFFSRPDTLSFGACNGCQMLMHLRELIPGSADWQPPRPNRSRRFEGRLVMVEIIESSPSVLFAGMGGWRLPVPVAHGEGRMAALPPAAACLRYIGQSYPRNPNGSDGGLTGVCNADGRVTAVMPHPERAFLNWQLSWHPASWRGNESPWMRLFHNARRWVDEN